MAKPVLDPLQLADFKEPDEPSNEELAAGVETQLKAVAAPPPDLRDKPVWTFDFDWADGRGKRWTGSFTNHILTVGQQGKVSILRSKLLGGAPVESMTASEFQLAHALAHMALSLRVTPKWANALLSLEDSQLIWALWKQVDSHEVRYFRLEAS